jgi:dimethylsulfone monooxygenase
MFPGRPDSVSMHDRIAMYGANRLKLGLFGANCSSARAVTKVPERWQATWEECLLLAQMAERFGIDFMLPIARWKGYGGDTDFQGTTLETVTWAAGLLAKTERLTVFGTVHAPLLHPIIAAKEFVTADLIGRGRFGLNVVVGWNEGEFEMFGASQREHEERYAYGQEWLDAVKALWGPGEDFDFDGTYIKLRGVRAKPKPYGGTRPIVMNAGASPRGRAFALRNCDAYFTAIRLFTLETVAREIADARAAARSDGREIGVYTTGQIVCRPTAKEAADYYRYWTEEMADWAAIDTIMGMRGERSGVTPDYDRLRRELVNGMSGFTMVGTPDDVTAALARVSGAGFDGIGFSFVNFLDELPYFAQEVLPRLERLGLRRGGPR